MLTVLTTVLQWKLIFTPQLELGIALFKADNDIMDQAGNKRVQGGKTKTKTILTIGVTFFCERGKEKLPFIIDVTEGSCQNTAWEPTLQLK
jgi:hypothetical protein